MALAAIGVYAAYADAASGPGDEVVVADRPLHVGDTIDADDLRTVAVEMPGDIVSGTFEDVDSAVGRVVLGPVATDEILQRGSVTDTAPAVSAHEIALTLPRSQIAVGRLKQGERVDVFVTTDVRTHSVVRGAQVVLISDDDGGSLTSARELTLVVAVPSPDSVAAVVHALRTGDVTVVRSTLAGSGDPDALVFEPSSDRDEGSGTDARDDES